jgi:peptidoglycan/LPS O-acetylase OafA/YrhL
VYSVPLCVTFLGMTYNEVTLDIASALWILFVCSLTGIVGATLFWYIVSRPLVERRKNRS